MFKDKTVRTTLKVLLTTLLFVAALFVVYRLKTIIIWVGIGSFLAIAMNPVVARFAKIIPSDRRGFATGLVALLIILFFLSMAALLLPPVIRQASYLIGNWPQISDGFLSSVEKSGGQPYKFIRENNLAGYITDNRAQIQQYLSNFFLRSLTNLSGLLSSIGIMLTIMAITVYMSVNGPAYVKSVRKLLPKDHRKTVDDLGAKMYGAVTGYVNGNLLTSLVAGMVTAAVGFFVGLPYAALLGIVVAIMDLIPMIGATVGAAIVLLIAFIASVKIGLIMLVFFIIYQQIENYVLVPRVMSRTVELSPFAVFLCVLAGGSVAGLVGAIIAIPLGACLQILIKYFYTRLQSEH